MMSLGGESKLRKDIEKLIPKGEDKKVRAKRKSRKVILKSE